MTKLNLLCCCIACCMIACQQNKTSDQAGKNALTTNSETETERSTKSIKAIELPTGYEIIGEAMGNLDEKEGDEKVIVYNTDRPTDLGTEREMRIYRQEKDRWVLWHTATKPLLTSESGGTLGDPFENVSITNQTIVLEHFGGSREKWKYLYRFRFQNEAWELIGATVKIGAFCEDWEEFDYNLSTGKIVYLKTKDRCNKGQVVGNDILKRQELVKKLDPLPNLDNFYSGENQVDIFGNGEMFYY